MITAMNGLDAPPEEPLTVVINLASGTTYGGITASPPPGVTLVINGDDGMTTIQGLRPP